MKPSRQNITDAFLVLEYRTGNKKALSVLVKRWHRRLCRQAWIYVKDVNDAQDIVQESWTIIMKKLHTLKDPDRFGSWAYTVVNRRALDFIRRKKIKYNLNSYKERGTDDPAFEFSESKQNYDAKIELLKKSINMLSSDQQTVLHLFYMRNYSLKQISDITGVSVGTVKSRLYHAREKLKHIVKNKK